MQRIVPLILFFSSLSCTPNVSINDNRRMDGSVSDENQDKKKDIFAEEESTPKAADAIKGSVIVRSKQPDSAIPDTLPPVKNPGDNQVVNIPKDNNSGPGDNIMPPPMDPPTPVPGMENPFFCEAPQTSAPGIITSSKSRQKNTLLDVFSPYITEQDVSVEFALIPDHYDKKSNFDNVSRALTDQDIEGYYLLSRKVASLVSINPSFINTRFGANCRTALQQNSNAVNQCLNNYFNSTMELVIGRPLENQERASYTSTITSDLSSAKVSEKVAFLVEVTLMHSGYLFQFQNGNGAMGAGKTMLELHELATRLSGALWNSSPDKDLMDKVKSGDLAQTSVYQNEVERLLADPKAKRSNEQYYSQWLHLKDTSSISQNAFSNDFLDGDSFNLSNHNKDAFEEAMDFVNHITFDTKGNFEALMTSGIAFENTNNIRESVKDSMPQNIAGSSAVNLEKDKRPGILWRMIRAELPKQVASENVNPIGSYIEVGAQIRRHLLCFDLPSPPASLANAIAETLNEENLIGKSPYEALDIKTSGATCKGCHNLINGLAFAATEIDTLGRYIEEGGVYDSNGNKVSSFPVESDVDDAYIEPDTQGKAVMGLADLAHQIALSKSGRKCIVERSAVFALASSSPDQCMMSRAYKALFQPGGTLLDMKRAIVMAPEFKLRNIDTAE